MYRVFHAEGGFEVFWCPSAPAHYTDRIPYDGKIYRVRSGAYRRVKQLNEALKARQAREKKQQKEDDTVVVA